MLRNGRALVEERLGWKSAVNKEIKHLSQERSYLDHHSLREAKQGSKTKCRNRMAPVLSAVGTMPQTWAQKVMEEAVVSIFRHVN